MGRTDNAAVSTAFLLKREDCKRTKHDSAFSQWKILIGPRDWEDYLLNNEGAERYRTQNLPNCASSSGLYELGIVVSLPRSEGNNSSKLDSKRIIPVYLGQADNVRTRLQQYGRDGAHLDNGLSNGKPSDRKRLGLFSEIFSNGFAIAYRWTPMESKKDAEKTEYQLLKTFDYAWNRGMNGDRRPIDIHQKLDRANSTKKLPPVLKKLPVFHPKKVGLSIKHCNPPMSENVSSFYTNQEDKSFLPKIFKFSRSRPTLVSNKCDLNNSHAGTCGVALGQGSVCTRPPVEGCKRCVDHKGMKVNAIGKPRLQAAEFYHSNIGDGSLTCGATTVKGSVCRRKAGENSKFCWQHEATRVKINHSSRVSDLYESCDSSTCGAITKQGTFCKRRTTGGRRCFQH